MLYHFVDRRRVGELQRLAFAYNGRRPTVTQQSDIGHYLHAVSDLYSHEGYDPVVGHAFVFGWPDKPWNRPFQLRRMIREKFDALTLIFENCFGGRVIVSFNRIDSGLMRRRSWVWSCCWPSALSWRGPSASSNGSAGTREIDSVHRDPLASASPVSFSDLGECADPRFEPGGQPQGDQGHEFAGLAAARATAAAVRRRSARESGGAIPSGRSQPAAPSGRG